MGLLGWIRRFRKSQDEDTLRRAEERVRERPEEGEPPEELPVLDASEKAGVMYGATPEVTEDDVDEDRPAKPGE